MPLGIAASDRKLLLIGGGLLVLMLAASVILAPPGEQFNSPVPSTYSTQSGGAQAAYLLLSELHYPVRRWEDAPTELPPTSTGILLILAEPMQFPSAKERKALTDFVEGGGHVLFTGPLIRNFFSAADVSPIPPDPCWKSFSPGIPSRIARGAAHVTIQPQAYWGRLNESQLVLYGETDSAVVVTWNVGHGQVLWWAGSTPLSNAGITREQNLALFLNSVARWSSVHPYQIDWDEYFHGQRSSLWSYFGKTSLVWGIFQLGVLAAAVLFSFNWAACTSARGRRPRRSPSPTCTFALCWSGNSACRRRRLMLNWARPPSNGSVGRTRESLICSSGPRLAVVWISSRLARL